MLVISFSTPDRVDFIHFFFTALQAVDPDFQGLPQDPPPLPFQVSDPKVLRHRMEASGLQDVQVTRETEHFEYKSGAGLWNSVLSSNPIATQVTAGLTEKQKRQAQQLLDERVEARAGRDGVAVLQA